MFYWSKPGLLVRQPSAEANSTGGLSCTHSLIWPAHSSKEEAEKKYGLMTIRGLNIK